MHEYESMNATVASTNFPFCTMTHTSLESPMATARSTSVNTWWTWPCRRLVADSELRTYIKDYGQRCCDPLFRFIDRL